MEDGDKLNWVGSYMLSQEEIDMLLSALSESEINEEEKKMVVVPGDIVRISNEMSRFYNEIGTVTEFNDEDESVKVRLRKNKKVFQFYLEDIEIVEEEKKEVDEMSDCQLYLMEKLAEYEAMKQERGLNGSVWKQHVYDFMSFVTGKSIYTLEDEAKSIKTIKKGEN